MTNKITIKTRIILEIEDDVHQNVIEELIREFKCLAPVIRIRVVTEETHG